VWLAVSRFKISDFILSTNETCPTEMLKFFRITESLEGISESHLIQVPSQSKAKSEARSGCSEPCPIMYYLQGLTISWWLWRAYYNVWTPFIV